MMEMYPVQKTQYQKFPLSIGQTTWTWKIQIPTLFVLTILLADLTTHLVQQFLMNFNLALSLTTMQCHLGMMNFVLSLNTS